MFSAIQKYNWNYLISDIIVTMLAAGISVLLENIKAIHLAPLTPQATGATAFVLNKLRQIC